MFAFFMNLLRFIKFLIKGIKKDARFGYMFIFILLLLFGSTMFYSKTEQWSHLDAFYFSAMTMATVGTGDLAPSTELGKLFTVIYTFLSIGAFVTFTVKMVHLALFKKGEFQGK